MNPTTRINRIDGLDSNRLLVVSAKLRLGGFGYTLHLNLRRRKTRNLKSYSSGFQHASTAHPSSGTTLKVNQHSMLSHPRWPGLVASRRPLCGCRPPQYRFRVVALRLSLTI